MINRTDSQAVLTLLELHSPLFQLKSGTEELKSAEQLLSRVSRSTGSITRASHVCSPNLLKYISEIASGKDVTLETGGGGSTCVFAASAKKHICVNPDITANELIQDFLRKYVVPIGELVFLNETSDVALPALNKSCQIDIALIDGSHSFPIPILDWHYIDLHLKVGGVVLIDDTNIRSVGVLCDYLSVEQSYTKIANIGNSVAYRKTAQDRVWGWSAQAFNNTFVAKYHSLVARLSRFLEKPNP